MFPFREGYHLAQDLLGPEGVPFSPNSRNELMSLYMRSVLIVLELDLVAQLPFVPKLSAGTVVLIHDKDEHQ
jgi:hypothetical protein